MAIFKIKKKTTVADIACAFQRKVGGVLKVYDGNNIAPDSEKLTSLGAKTGEVDCDNTATVEEFVNLFQRNLNLKVKVFTKDGWVMVLDDIQLRMIKYIPKQTTKAKMESFTGNPGCFRRFWLIFNNHK